MKKANSSQRMKKMCVVLACDRNFFDIAQGLMLSLNRCRQERKWMDIGFLSIDCTADQLDWLRDQGVKVVPMSPGPALVPAGAPIYAQAQTCRPYLREYFPGYEVYMWLDSDIRIQDCRALQVYYEAAAARPDSIAIVREADPSYSIFRDALAAHRYYSENYQRLSRYYSNEIADQLKFLPVYNNGCVALHRDSQYWVAWRECLLHALQQGYDYYHDQDSLNVAILLRQSVQLLPARFNWLCGMSFPVRNGKGAWCQQNASQDEIAVLHLIACNSILQGGVKMKEYYRQQGLL